MTALVLLAHGSRDPRWQQRFYAMCDALRAQLGDDRVGLAFLDHCPPTLKDTIAELAAAGASELSILPLFMATGAHVDRDLPRQLSDIDFAYPELTIEVLSPVGEHPLFVDLIARIAADTVA